jgi:hypothetical protein
MDFLMPEQIRLEENVGDVVLVDGLCYEFSGYAASRPNVCNSCDPPLATFYTVTLSGLTGPWAEWNGANPVELDPRYPTCDWFGFDSNGDIGIWFQYSDPRWELTLSPYLTGNQIVWKFLSAATGCVPEGSYGTHLTCTSADPADCTNQGDTTCVVTKGLEVAASFNTCVECSAS